MVIDGLSCVVGLLELWRGFGSSELLPFNIAPSALPLVATRLAVSA